MTQYTRLILNEHCTWTHEKPAAAKRHSLARRLAYGPASILTLCVGSSGLLVAALLVRSILDF